MIVHESLPYLLVGVHHEGAMTRNRLFEGLTCDEHEFGSLFSPNTVLDFFFFALFEDATVEMSYLMGCLLC